METQIAEFIRGLFSTAEWPPRWKCGYWTDFHGWLYILSDTMIWVAYFLIPVMIVRYFSNKKGTIQFRRVYVLFASFILLCGATHLMDAMMFWVPMYRLNAILRFVTGIVSLATVYHLVKILPEAFRQKTNVELEREITKRKETEVKLADANANLEAFAYVASHDLQEPLRKIRMYTSLLHDNTYYKLDEENKHIADRIVSSASRMQQLIRDVLVISSLRVDMDFESVQPNEAINIALEDLALKIKEKNALINIDPLPAVKGNTQYLAQMFMNLINNSLKFSKKRPEIIVSAYQEAPDVFISIKDNGIGMDKEDMKKIFFAFQKLHPTAEYEGSGIGLAICKRIVDLHHGKISVQSVKDEGTAFIIQLPKA